ncbi:unnamed protein product [Aureobasidium vineae]|uniref:C2H2-type domain-containing protein n=1 Tax=Aureobasidium vineae TaxID=2773715 RepID=A0A9N8P6K9_9PEZI|nr:unnamed protein product [Aureobasidium vineae]
MVIRYDPYDRIGTQAEAVTIHSNPMQAIDAFYRLFTGPERQWEHHDFLKNGQYLINWLNAHLNPEKPEPNDLVDEVMSDLTQDLTVYHEITYITIIPYDEWNSRDHGTLAERLEGKSGVLPHNDRINLDPGPDPQLPDEEMVDADDVVMSDHDLPPSSAPPRRPSEYSFLNDEIQAQLLPFETEPFDPLFATPTPGPVPLPSANNAPAPPPPANNPRTREIRDTSLGDLNSRRRFPCTFTGCNKRFTRQSDLRRHCVRFHPSHPQTQSIIGDRCSWQVSSFTCQ